MTDNVHDAGSEQPRDDGNKAKAPPKKPNAAADELQEPPKGNPDLKVVGGAESIFSDIKNLRTSATPKIGRKVVQVNITVGKPPNNVFFRCHPSAEMSLDASVLIGTKGSNDFYFVAPNMLEHRAVVRRLRPVTIAVTYIWPGREIGLWPVPIIAPDASFKVWKSQRAAYEMSKGQWTQMVYDPRRVTLKLLPRRAISRSPFGRRNTAPTQTSRCRSCSPSALAKAEQSAPRSIPMSCNCAALPNSFEVYREVQHIDFEFRIDGNHRAVPVAMFAKERRSGRETQLRRDQLLTLKCAPFDVGPGALMVSYSIVAELSCFKALDWPMPRNALCTYFLASAQVNGLDIDGLRSKRPSLLESCSLFGVPHATDAEHKERMRRLILEN
jgi:hypothetical protein